MSDTVRVYEIAEEAGASSQDVIAKAKDLGIDLKSAQTAVSYADAEEITNYILTGKSKRIKETAATKPKKVVKPQEEVKEELVVPVVEKEEVQNIEQKKPELKKVAISKPIQKTPVSNVEEIKPEIKDDDSNKIVPKRKGLVIIKKKTPREENTSVSNFDSNQEKKPTK